MLASERRAGAIFRVNRQAIPDGHIDPDGAYVAALLGCVANDSAKSPDTKYVCTKGDGALILEMVVKVLRAFR